MVGNFKKCLSTFALSAAIVSSVNAYDIVDRAKLIDDRFKTLEMMSPWGHNFVIPDINAAVSADVTDLKDVAEDIDDIDTGNTTDDVAAINDLLDDFYDKEKMLRLNFGLGFPIFSFSAYGVDFKPRFNLQAGLFAVLTPQKETLSYTDVISNLELIPADLRDQIIDCLDGLSDGDDILDPANGCVSAQEAQLIKDEYEITELEYDTEVINGTEEVPLIDIYAKVEAKAGLWFDYEKDQKWFGTFGLYALGRVDIYKRADTALLLAGAGDLDPADNKQVNLAFDYKLGYRHKNYSFFAALEEVKIAEMASEDEADLNFGDDMLIRLHAMSEWEFSIVKIYPYIGTHSRSGYGLGDAYYIGSDFALYTWEDRLGLIFKTQLDKEHATLGLKAKLWLAHLDLSGKFAIKDNVDGIKVSNSYSANIRFFF